MENFVEKFSDLVVLFNYDVDLHAQNNLIKLQILIYNLHSSTKYYEVFAYAWYKSGYINGRSNKFESPINFAFSR